MRLIELAGVTKDYQLGSVEVAALRGVDLIIEAGEFTVIAGPSGSGKTTLLNIIGLLDERSGGDYRLDGELIAATDFDQMAEMRNQKIGFVFQSFNLIPVLSVKENIMLPLLLRGNASPAAAERLIDAVGLGAHASHRPGELSGGQQQRVAIARALVTAPKLVLADEPTANVDSRTATALIDLMLQLNEERGVTFLFSTHDHRLMQRARRVVELEDGVVAGPLAAAVAG